MLTLPPTRQWPFKLGFLRVIFSFILVPTGNLYNIYSCHVQSNLFWVFTEPMPESAITNATKKATEFPKRKRFLLHVCFGAGQILLAKTLENFSLPYSLLLDYSTFEFYYPTLPYPKLKNHYPSGPCDEQRGVTPGWEVHREDRADLSHLEGEREDCWPRWQEAQGLLKQ